MPDDVMLLAKREIIVHHLDSDEDVSEVIQWLKVILYDSLLLTL